MLGFCRMPGFDESRRYPQGIGNIMAEFIGRYWIKVWQGTIPLHAE